MKSLLVGLAMVMSIAVACLAFDGYQGHEGQIPVCQNKKTGVLRFAPMKDIDPTIKGVDYEPYCSTTTETMIWMNIQGIQGPQGTKGDTGAMGATGAAGTIDKSKIYVVTCNTGLSTDCKCGSADGIFDLALNGYARCPVGYVLFWAGTYHDEGEGYPTGYSAMCINPSFSGIYPEKLWVYCVAD